MSNLILCPVGYILGPNSEGAFAVGSSSGGHFCTTNGPKGALLAGVGGWCEDNCSAQLSFRLRVPPFMIHLILCPVGYILGPNSRVFLRSGPVREGTFSRRMVPKEYFWLATGPVVLDETVPPECHGRERLRKCAQDTSTEDERAKMLPCVAPDLHARHLRPLARIFLPSYVYNLAKAFSYVYNLAKISSYVY
jgi:hypothetical protein